MSDYYQSFPSFPLSTKIKIEALDHMLRNQKFGFDNDIEEMNDLFVSALDAMHLADEFGIRKESFSSGDEFISALANETVKRFLHYEEYMMRGIDKLQKEYSYNVV